jgi:2-amino-4-hydroxy-6-hydroxymethyldihydropteridine diphosphokinase
MKQSGVRQSSKSKVRSPNPKARENSLGTKQSRDLRKLAIIALGSNMGDAKSNVLRAMERLQKFSDKPIRRSSLWETSPVDCPRGSPMFVNAVIGFLPREGETPESLLAKLQFIEKEFGRTRKKVLNEPRPLDLDLIAFQSEQRNSRELTLPHPRAHQRKFVLGPLAEIAPGLVFPGQEKTVAELLRDCRRITPGERSRPRS